MLLPLHLPKLYLLSRDFVLADISVRSPGELLIFSIKNNIYRINFFFSIENEIAVPQLRCGCVWGHRHEECAVFVEV